MEPPRHPPPAACFRTIREPALYRNFAVHAFVMFPAALAMCAFAAGVDRTLAIPPLLPLPVRLVAGGAMVALGATWVWYVYGFLYLAGQGSPGSHVDGGPTRLVDTGPYTVVRHPSVLGKLVGVMGLGVAWGSPTFLGAFVPVLVLYSLVTSRLLQERFCDQRFGERYARYRARVPMLLPRPSGIRRWLRREPALPDASPTEGVHPPGIKSELPWYLVGLALLLGAFALVWWILGSAPR